MWVLLSLLSALCLGFYDISKKRSLQQNSVLDVLTLSLLISSAILLVPLVLSRCASDAMQDTLFYVPAIDAHAHLMILLKSCIVLSSWVCAYAAIKYLPLSIVSPMQATRPMWTLLGAMVLFGEVLNGWQWAGILCALGSVFALSLVEHKAEKVPATTTASTAAVSAATSVATDTPRSKTTYYICLALAILIGAGSGLYDKYMMRHFDHNAVQVYYTIYQAVIMTIALLIIRMVEHIKTKKHAAYINDVPTASFRWTWAIAGISVFLVLSDYVYMLALSNPASLISVVSTIRRGGTLIAFLYGLIVLKEKSPGKKLACLLGIFLGLLCLALGSC